MHALKNVPADNVAQATEKVSTSLGCSAAGLFSQFSLENE